MLVSGSSGRVGVVEGANKVVVEGRLKGAGMRWAREHVNPMVALRTVVYSDRWDEGWAQISSALCEEEREGRTRRRQSSDEPGACARKQCRAGTRR